MKTIEKNGQHQLIASKIGTVLAKHFGTNFSYFIFILQYFITYLIQKHIAILHFVNPIYTQEYKNGYDL